MNEPPKMISTKDLAYISDMFEWNFVVAKAAHQFEAQIQDSEIKDLIHRVFEMHKGICQKLIAMLGGNQS